MKKLIRALAAISLLSGFMPLAMAAAPQQPANMDASGLLSPAQIASPAMTGVLAYTVDSGTATYQGVMVPGTSGNSGMLYGVVITSGSLSDQAIVVDTTSAATILTAGSAQGATSANFIGKTFVHLAPVLVSAGSNVTGCTSPALCGVFYPPWPVRFSNGLVVDRAGTANVTVYYRLDAATSTSAHP